MKPLHNNAVTLLELLIAIAILGLIVLGISNLQLFSHYQVATADRRAVIQNGASFVLEHMAKYIGQAIGDFNNPAIVAYADNKGIRIKIDSNGNGRRDDDTVDLWIAYRHEDLGTTDSEIRFYPNAGTGATPTGLYESIARQVVITNFSDPPEKWGLALYINFDASNRLMDNNIKAQIKCRWNPSQAVSSDNPEVTMSNNIKMPSVSTN